eukprot:966107_1
MDDKVFQWIFDRVDISMRGNIKPAKFRSSFETEENIGILKQFVTTNSSSILWYFGQGDVLLCSVKIRDRPASKKKSLVFVKTHHKELVIDTVSDDVFSFEITNKPLHNLSMMSSKIYFPLICNPKNQIGWSGPISNEVVSRLDGFLSQLYITSGKCEGKTLLPLPPNKLFSSNVIEKDRIHTLETLIVGWTRQIQDVLQMSVEGNLKKGGTEFPDPLDEVSFWKSKSANLESLHMQLDSDSFKSIIMYLEKCKSSYCSSFYSIVSKVAEAMLEAKENYLFLNSASKYFSQLREVLDFPTLSDTFAPMLNTILLVWRNTDVLKRSGRIIGLVEEISNAIIEQAQKFANGDAIFRLIDDDNATDAVKLITTCTSVCQNFIDTFEHIEKLSKDGKSTGWDQYSKKSMFGRLNLFLERSKDILEFVILVQDFGKLDKIYISGTKGNSLTDSVRELFTEFQEEVGKFKILPFDVMDIAKLE